MTAAERPVPARAILTAIATALASLAALAAVGLSATQDAAAPALTATAWIATAVTLVLQSATLLGPLFSGTGGLLVAAALPIPLAAIAPGPLHSVTALPLIVIAFLAGLRMPLPLLKWWALLAAVLVAAGHVLGSLGEGRTDIGTMLLQAAGQAVIVIGLPILPASAIAAQRTARAAQEQTVAALTRERDAQIGEAIAVERAAMARELHDIAAHHLSGISLVASAIAKQVDTDPDAARANALHIRTQTGTVLEDLRRLVGLLRSTGDVDDAVKTVATIPSLIEAASATGQHIELDLRTRSGVAVGEGIGPLGELAAYRMVQEALTNATRYAPGADVTVVVDDTAPERVTVVVRNGRPTGSPAAEGSGFGILGMRERATLTGGTFAAGPTPDGGWEARMEIPRETRPTERQEQS